MRPPVLAVLLATVACGSPPAAAPPAPAASAPAAPASQRGGLYLAEVTTARGTLEPVKVTRAKGEACVELRLAGQAVGEDCESESAWVQAVYPPEAAARLVLVGLSPGGNTCPEFYRVVEVPPQGKARVSERFGNCSEFTEATWTAAGWRIEIPAYAGGSFVHPKDPGQAWVYRDGILARETRP
jgi:hypothetical protein